MGLATRAAHERVQDPGQDPLEGDAALAAVVTAAHTWHQWIYREQATDTVLEHVQNLSPWEFCHFLTDLAVADPTTPEDQDWYFCELANRISG